MTTLRDLLDAIAAGNPIDITALDRDTLRNIDQEATAAWTAGWDAENKRPTEGTNPALLKAIMSLTKSVRDHVATLPAEVPAEAAEFDLADIAALFPGTPAPAPTPVAEVPAPAPAPAPEATPEPVAVAASTVPAVPLGGLTPPPKPPSAKRPLGLVASAGSNGFYSGAESEMAIEQFHEQVASRAERILAGGDANGTVARIASTTLGYTDPRRLSANYTAAQNTRLMAQLDEMPQAKTAAGGFIGPIDFSRDIPWYVKQGRPVKDSLRSRPAQRGRIKLNKALPLYDVVPATPSATDYPPDGIGVWDKTDDAAASLSDANTWKVCEEMDDSSYPAEVTIETYALTKCFRHSHMQAMSSPELLEALLTRQRARFDRYAESKVLQQWYDTAVSDGTWYQFTPPYGQATDLFFTLQEALMADGWQGRYDLTGARMYIPRDFLKYLVLAEHNSGFGDRKVRVSDIKAIMGDLGFDDVVEYIDDRADAGTWTYEQPPALVLPHQINTTFSIAIIFPEDWVLLDAGTIDFGMDRDIHAHVNKVRMLWETFEGLGNVGNRPTLWVDVTLCASGARAALVTPTTCANAS